MAEIWSNKCFSRLLIDNHITEDDSRFMSGFSPDEYVAMVKKAGVESAMVYACCHNGNCYYPTKIGHMHKNLNGRDIFGETISGLKEEGIVPIAYYTLIYHNRAAIENPDWAMVDALDSRRHGRYWHTCPNASDSLEFYKTQIAEIIAYEIEGIFIDMTFWAKVCYCKHCRKRYCDETGHELPEVIDWNDSKWVTFQRHREKWMAEFAQAITDHIKKVKPSITVTHQFSPVLAGWLLGQSGGIAAASDYPSGDFYGGKDQHRLGMEVFNAFRHNNMPVEFMTSRCVDLWDHTSMKSEEELFCSAVTTLAHGGAYFFIDAINPDGTLESRVYERLGKVSDKTKPFKNVIKKLRPEIQANVGLYFSMESNDDARLNDIALKDFILRANNMEGERFVPTVKELLGTSVLLGKCHIPYKVVTPESKLDRLSTVIINNVKYMTADEVSRIRQFVSDGGTLIATGNTSLCDMNGSSSGDFALADVFGVSYSGVQAPRVNYLKDESGYVVSDEPAPLVKTTTARLLSQVVLPYFDPDDTERYASIHSNPPGKITDFAAMAVNNYGRGRCVYLYSSILGTRHDAHRQFAMKLLMQYIPRNIIVECNAPACVKVTLLKNESFTAMPKYLLCFVNWQNELPNVPVHDITTSFKLATGLSCEKCTRVSDGRNYDFSINGQVLTLRVPKLDCAEFFEFTLINPQR